MIGNKLQVISYLANIKQDNKLYEVKEYKSKRSNEQNKMLWKLIHLIAKEKYQDDMEVYITILEKADAKSDYIIAMPETENELKKNFRAVKFIRQQIVNKTTMNVYKVYIGSSKMNTKEMTELLDIAFQICAKYQIPTIEGV